MSAATAAALQALLSANFPELALHAAPATAALRAALPHCRIAACGDCASVRRCLRKARRRGRCTAWSKARW